MGTIFVSLKMWHRQFWRAKPWRWLGGSMAFVWLVGSVHGEAEIAPSLPNPSAIETLALAHCGRCHTYTPPEILPQRSWNILMRYMGLRMGVDPAQLTQGLPPAETELLEGRRTLLEEANLLPESPVVSADEWSALFAYYLDNSPKQSLPQSEKAERRVAPGYFRPKATQYRLPAAVTTLAMIDETHQQVLLGDSRAERFTLLDRNLNLVAEYPTRSSLWVRATPTNRGIYLLSIGDLTGAGVGERRGNLFYGRRLADQYLTEGTALKGLYRPSDMAWGDLDGDRIPELVVASFGVETGSVTVHRRDDAGPAYVAEPMATLSNLPGAVDCEIQDFNRDGRLDVAVLMSDAREKFSIFLNQGNWQFEEHVIVESSPAFGYVGFRLADVNDDGWLDVVTINGDNVDSDPYNTLKPYHGIRIYHGGPDLAFSEAFFYPLHGAYGAEVADFDLDGDLDIAAIAFNPDFTREPLESFVLLEQNDAGIFSASAHPATLAGRWLTMDAGDIDGDGDADLILGAGYVPAGLDIDHPDILQRQLRSGPPILFLENTAR